MKKPLILKGISHRFDQVSVLEDFDLTINPGTIHTLIGTTGAGKSLLLKLMSNLLPVQKGNIGIDNESIAFVFQDNAFFSWLTIQKNLELTTSLKLEELLPWLKKFKLEEFLPLYPKHLSGGTAQKFNLLRAFLNRSSLVLLDEPFSHLDMIQKESLYNFTLELWQDYRPTIMLVTHDIDEALYLSHQVSFLSKKTKNIVKTVDIRTDENLNRNFLEERSRPDYLRKFAVVYDFLAEDLS